MRPKPAGHQSTFQAAAALAGRHRAAAPRCTKVSQYVRHARKHILGRGHLGEKVTGITFANRRHFLPRYAGIQLFQSFNHAQTNDIAIGFALQFRIPQFGGCLVKAVCNMINGIHQRSVPVKNHNLYVH